MNKTILKTHGKDEIETILKITGNNCDIPITYQNNAKKLYNYIGCIQDIAEELGIDTCKNYITMSNILEYNDYYTFDLIYFNQKHGSYAMYCLESVSYKKYTIKINKGY